MVSLYQKQYLYFDKNVIHDEATLDFLKEMAEKHRPLYMYLHDIWELEEVKHLEAYDYICEVVYGDTMESAVKAFAQSNKQNMKQVVMLHSYPELQSTGIDAICIVYDEEVSVKQFQKERMHQKKKRAIFVYSTILVGIVYFTLYFSMLDYMPVFMIEGTVAMLLALVPMTICIAVFFYGLYSDVIPWHTLLELLDIIS